MENKETTSNIQKDLVVVGSSAGGVEALSVLVSTLPADFPAPIVLAQHLDPHHVSTLDAVLQRHTQLPVEVILEGTILRPGRIYVIPANRHVSIHDHQVEVREDPSRTSHPRPSIDLLLSTAAKVYGEHLIAVILTGSGADGAMGATEVKDVGGTVIVQNPQTARYPSMPLALPPTVIDFEVDLEQIGTLLYNLLTTVNKSPTERQSRDALRDILEQVSQQGNIDFRSYKTSTILRRISKRMVLTQCPTMQDYADYLPLHPEEVEELIKAFLINVTQFFRDPEAFEYLRTDILPKLIEHARAHSRVLRFWDAGCATGEEAYSLAMLVADLLGSELSQWNVKIFATDLDEAAINFARHGLYSENLLKGLASKYRDHFFEREEAGYRITKVLRQMVIFGHQDLTRSAPFPRINLVLCRNVLIYFTPELQEYVLHQFAFALSPDGYLFLGKAEAVRTALPFYELVDKHWKVYRCTGRTPPILRNQASIHLDAQHRMGKRARSYEPPEEKQPGEQTAPSNLPFELGQLRRFNELILRFLPMGIVVIDRNYRILTANGAARRLLGLREAGVEMDFLHAIHGAPYHEMRSAIDTVLRQHASVTLPEIELETAQRGSGHFISLSFALMQLESNLPELVIISATDITQQVQERHKLEKVQAEQAELVKELETVNTRLSETNRELLDSNEKLQVANEELLLTHEELQASIEEFETTNEELQATNEEVETSNEELQATNEEIETINEELRIRSNELQTLNTTLENERKHLAEMVEFAPFYMMVLSGPHLTVEAYNSNYARLIERQQRVHGHPLDEMIDLFWENGMEIVHLARDAYRLGTEQKIRRVQTHLRYPQNQAGNVGEMYFSYIAVPSRNAEGKVDGVVLYALDETAERFREVEEEHKHLNLVFNNVSQVALALFDVQTHQLLVGSTPYLTAISQMSNVSQENLIGHTWEELTLFTPDERVKPTWEAAIQKSMVVHVPELVAMPSKDGRERIWDYAIAPLVYGAEPTLIRYMLVSLVDVTEQIKARRELEQIDMLKDEFLSLAAHELRTPLTTISGNAQMLNRILRKAKEQPSTESELAQTREREVRTLETITHQVTRMNRLIADMLDVTRLRGNVLVLNNVENVEIVPLVQRVIEPYKVQGREMILHVNDGHLRGRYDPDRLEQVLVNLVSNAVKYSPAHTPVEITVTHKEAEVVVSVHDEGLGISPEEQAHLFERFYRTKKAKDGDKEGLGLGLYIAHEIVEKQGGHLWFESEPGKGSTFFFSLPLNQE